MLKLSLRVTGPRGRMLGLRPPDLAFRILCLEGSAISFISPSYIMILHPINLLMMLQVITQTAPHTSARTVDDGLPVECYGERLVGDAGRLRQNDQATCRDQDIPEPSE